MIEQLTVKLRDKKYEVDLSQGHDLSIPVDASQGARAWYVDLPKITPVRTEHFTGSVAEGGGVNFRNIFFNPHGNGTHTECLGHITKEVHSVNKVVKNYFFDAELITVQPKKTNNHGEEDWVITGEMIKDILGERSPEALVIRTLPNSEDKTKKDYSETHPPYFTLDAISYINSKHIYHLLIDLPSVDREKDEGVLAAHHLFWSVPENPNFEKTITEFIYADSSVKDGHYLLNLQLAPFENDATPSRPMLYPLKQIK